MPASLLFPLDFQRQYAGPLDPDIVFDTTANRNAYLTNARRYAGMVVADQETEGIIYVLNNARDTWLAVGAGGGELQLSATGTDNLGTTGLGSFASIAAGAVSNIAIGRDSLAALTDGDYNIGIGHSTSVGASHNGCLLLGYGMQSAAAYDMKLGYNNLALLYGQGINDLSTATLAINAGGGVEVAGGATGSYRTLTSSANITPDFSAGNYFSLTLATNTTLENPTGINATAGQAGVIAITQDGTGSRTMAFGTYWKFAGGTAPTLSTAAGAKDLLCWQVISSTEIVATLIADVS